MLISGCGQSFAHAQRCPTGSIAPAAPLRFTDTRLNWHTQGFISLAVILNWNAEWKKLKAVTMKVYSVSTVDGKLTVDRMSRSYTRSSCWWRFGVCGHLTT